MIYRSVSSLLINGTNIFAGAGGGGVYLSTNSGLSWTLVNSGMWDPDIFALAISGNNLFAGTWGGGVFASSNNGTKWNPVDSGLTNSYASLAVVSLVILDSNIYAGTVGSGVWRRPLSEVITAIKRSRGAIVTTFSLSQNYPNPFNPSTIISFDIPSRSLVSLKVFDGLGKEVSTIASGELEAGHYTRRWNAAGLASGLHFYRLLAGSYSETKKLMLLK